MSFCLANDYLSLVVVCLPVALATNVLMALHICWGVLWFSGWDGLHEAGYFKSSSLLSWLNIVTVLVTHMLISCLVSARVTFKSYLL